MCIRDRDIDGSVRTDSSCCLKSLVRNSGKQLRGSRTNRRHLISSSKVSSSFSDGGTLRSTPVLCVDTVSYTHLRAHETVLDLVCRLLLEKKKKKTNQHNVAHHYIYNHIKQR
eukprot:TRINITY_DN2556_c0_g1_i1.p1 TRINITY_DN2556_c0_g1~~TRINITY_DN2556_c0_g1_i1.p1  ORF type:complete len:113 (+),score=28.91 TRINITY_DN2556_c0_g1_i1:163-501(+)